MKEFIFKEVIIMKTFLSFITGLLGGILLGMIYTSWAALNNESLREYFEKEALD